MAVFSIVVPFYQRQDGILRRALSSVFAQNFQDYELVIVDDQSPHPLSVELEPLAPDERARIRTVSQTNAGPGGARNTGLDHVPAEARYVAFLDSDDFWTPDHLANAYQAMQSFDADCYFASIEGGSEFDYHFAISDLERSEPAQRLSDAPPIIEIPDIAAVMLKNWAFLHLSAMVIGRPLFEKIRFDAALRLAAEDVLFFCDCMLAAKRVLLCAAPGALRGEGVNIFHGVNNESPEFLRQQFITWMALDRLQSRFVGRPKEVATINAYKMRARHQALWGQVARLRHRRAPDLSLLARWAWRDPRLIGSVVGLAAAKLKR